MSDPVSTLPTAHPAPFEVRVGTEPDGLSTITVRGELDLATAPQLAEALSDGVLGPCRRVLVDLREVTFLDSSGVGTLVAARKQLASRDTHLALRCLDGPVTRILTVTGLLEVLDVTVDRPA